DQAPVITANEGVVAGQAVGFLRQRLRLIRLFLRQSHRCQTLIDEWIARLDAERPLQRRCGIRHSIRTRLPVSGLEQRHDRSAADLLRITGWLFLGRLLFPFRFRTYDLRFAGGQRRTLSGGLRLWLRVGRGLWRRRRQTRLLSRTPDQDDR